MLIRKITNTYKSITNLLVNCARNKKMKTGPVHLIIRIHKKPIAFCVANYEKYNESIPLVSQSKNLKKNKYTLYSKRYF